ncbi:hypothetical protein V5O48_008565 [Marasmius crinis-equi]|uniref:Uncharacterized protein n=1 Tax=Marasmius crinis-equi TaxID=585013 RepID=A0ABR3FDK8_9AGAR
MAAIVLEIISNIKHIRDAVFDDLPNAECIPNTTAITCPPNLHLELDYQDQWRMVRNVKAMLGSLPQLRTFMVDIQQDLGAGVLVSCLEKSNLLESVCLRQKAPFEKFIEALGDGLRAASGTVFLPALTSLQLYEVDFGGGSGRRDLMQPLVEMLKLREEKGVPIEKVWLKRVENLNLNDLEKQVHGVVGSEWVGGRDRLRHSAQYLSKGTVV